MLIKSLCNNDVIAFGVKYSAKTEQGILSPTQNQKHGLLIW
jgi:hypothetical protein